MNDCISRAALKEYIKSNTDMTPVEKAAVLLAISNAPTATPEVRRGKWKYCGSVLQECQNCGEIYSLTGNDGKAWNFCPNCGADMREVEHETD